MLFAVKNSCYIFVIDYLGGDRRPGQAHPTTDSLVTVMHANLILSQRDILLAK